jgi:hypothetical protein
LAAGVDGEVIGRTIARTSRSIGALLCKRLQSTLWEQIFDVAITEGEANIEPDRTNYN